MKKTKRCQAMLIAMIMIATVCIGNNPVIVFADEMTKDITVEATENDVIEADNTKTNLDIVAMKQGDVSTMSLLPLEEVEAYLILNGKTDEELKTFSVDEMLNSMVDKEGNPISIFPSDATTVWRYVKDQDANVENYEEYSIGTEETIDLTTGENIYNYHLELIVGSGSQLNSNNVRYIVKVYVTNTVREELDYTLYLEDSNGSRNEVIPERTSSAINTQLVEIGDITANEYAVPECPEGSQYYLGIS